MPKKSILKSLFALSLHEAWGTWYSSRASFSLMTIIVSARAASSSARVFHNFLTSCFFLCSLSPAKSKRLPHCHFLPVKKPFVIPQHFLMISAPSTRLLSSQRGFHILSEILLHLHIWNCQFINSLHFRFYWCSKFISFFLAAISSSFSFLAVVISCQSINSVSSNRASLLSVRSFFVCAIETVSSSILCVVDFMDTVIVSVSFFCAAARSL